MNIHFTKTIAAMTTALMLGGAVLATSAPANAGQGKFANFAGGYHQHSGGGSALGWGAAALIGGLALGAIAAQNAQANECGYVRQPMYDGDGDFIGYRNVPTC